MSASPESTGSGAARRRIGTQARERAASLAVLARALRRVAPSSAAPRLDALDRAIAPPVTRIAFAGLAGAASRPLLCAAADRPGLLPVDRMRQSHAVTRLALGHPEGRDRGASFRLFDSATLIEIASAWSAAAHVDDGQSEQDRRDRIDRELIELRRAADRRHGTRLAELSGARHDAPEANPETLARYLRGTPPDAPPPAEGPPDCALLTREAVIHEAIGPFACPVELVDTPGLGGERALAEAVTWPVLEGADGVILVLDATRAPGKRDDALLRAAIRMAGDRLGVVLDRGDEVSDPESVLAAVRARVERAAAETRHAAPPVIAGSARLAARAALIRESAAGDRAGALEERAGIAALSALLDEMIFWGPAAAAYREAAGSLQQLADEMARELDGLAAGQAVVPAAPPAAVPEPPPGARERLEAVIEDGRARLEDEIDRTWSRFAPPMQHALARRAHALAEEAHAALDAGAGRIGRIPLDGIASGLGHDLGEARAEAGRPLAGILREIAAEAQGVLAEAAPWAAAPEPGTGALVDPPPAPLVIEAPAALTLDISRRGFLLDGYFRRSERIAAIAGRLIRLLMPGMMRAIEDSSLALGQAARTTLESYATAAEARMTAPPPRAVTALGAHPARDGGEADAAALAERAAWARDIAGRAGRIRAAVSPPRLVGKAS